MSAEREPIVLVIDATLPRERLDVYLRDKLPQFSRGTIQRLLAEGHIKIDGKAVKPTRHPRAGETVVVEQPAPVPLIAEAEDIPLDVLYEDDDLLVINKPAGLVVHPAAGHREHTLVNALLHHCGGQLSGVGGVARPGIVHRLDKDTSGCLVVAKTDAAHAGLSAQFANREVAKIYEAIVCGKMPRSSGRIDAAIGRDRSDRKRMAVNAATGRQASTTFRILERWAEATLLEVVLHTGRTHQIRVHLRHLGFPVAGDLVYGRRGTTRLKESTGYSAPRLLLHARRLSFTHPRSGLKLTVEAPLPEDFTSALAFFED